MSRFKDINNKDSMKRYWSNKFFELGYWMVIVFSVLWIFTEIWRTLKAEEFTAIVVPETIANMWKWMMGFGSIVILGTILEGKFNKK